MRSHHGPDGISRSLWHAHGTARRNGALALLLAGSLLGTGALLGAGCGDDPSGRGTGGDPPGVSNPGDPPTSGGPISGGGQGSPGPGSPSGASPSEYGGRTWTDGPDGGPTRTREPMGGSGPPAPPIPWQGFGVPPPAAAQARCEESIELGAAPAPDVLLLVDGSGSTAQDLAGCYRSGSDEVGQLCTFEDPTKWSMIDGAVDRLLDLVAGSIRFGLSLFPLAGSQCSIGGITVAPGDHTASAIRAALAQVEPAGGTPTRLALEGARAAFAGSGDRARAVVLITDGLPTCNPTPNDRDDADAVVGAVRQLGHAGGRTFVVGVGRGVGSDTALLSELAHAGGTARASAPTPYYQADSPDALISALEDVAASAVACTAQLEGVPANPEQLEVSIDGQPLPRDVSHANGWDYVPSDNLIQLYGPACDDLRDHGGAIDVKYLCRAVQ